MTFSTKKRSIDPYHLALPCREWPDHDFHPTCADVPQLSVARARTGRGGASGRGDTALWRLRGELQTPASSMTESRFGIMGTLYPPL